MHCGRNTLMETMGTQRKWGSQSGGGLLPVQPHQLLTEGSAERCGRPRQAGVGPQECFSGKWETAGRGTREEAGLSTCLFLKGVLCFLLSTQMKKVMLTVFKHNHGAYQFFREALQ